ncbi:MAG TPA: Na/Pi cotransporter family protein, partial [Acidisoma sp.]|nr:Na/Pi cotransporter family protein [Acidisoma sp.]
MDLSLTLLQLAGYVALLLWGVHMVQTGVQRAFGARLRGFLGSALRNRLKAFLAGIGVTAILQSSTATGLMVTGFAAGGLVDLVPALAVMLGANVGTTLIVQLLSFNMTGVAPALVLIGVLMFRRATAATRDFGRVFIGLGLVLIALGQFVDIVTPYEDVPSLKLFLGAVANQPLVDVILAAGLTWAAHSSVAVVLLVMSFAGNNVVPPDAAFALVLGANLGTAINPVLEGAGGNDPAARRVPMGNLLTRAVGTLIALPMLPWLGTLLITVEPEPGRAVADFHTAFNLLLAAAFFPFLKTYAALLRRLLPARVDPADPAQPLYLAAAAREAPVIALGAAAREALRLADVLEAMLVGLRDAFARPDRRQIAETKRQDDVLDKLNAAIKAYLTSLDTEDLTAADHQRVTEILTFATHMEQAGDIVEQNLLGIVTKKLRRGLAFSKA